MAKGLPCGNDREPVGPGQRQRPSERAPRPGRDRVHEHQSGRAPAVGSPLPPLHKTSKISSVTIMEKVCGLDFSWLFKGIASLKIPTGRIVCMPSSCPKWYLRPLPAPRPPPPPRSPLFPQTRRSPQALLTRLPLRSPCSSPGRTGHGHAAQTDCDSNYFMRPVVHQSVDVLAAGAEVGAAGGCGRGVLGFWPLPWCT